jgi:hypothetical protein
MLKRHERRGDECPRERGQHPGSRVWDLWAMASWVLATGWRAFAPAMAPVGNRRQGAPADVANPPWPPGQGSRLSPTVVFADGRYPLPGPGSRGPGCGAGQRHRRAHLGASDLLAVDEPGACLWLCCRTGRDSCPSWQCVDPGSGTRTVKLLRWKSSF